MSELLILVMVAAALMPLAAAGAVDNPFRCQACRDRSCDLCRELFDTEAWEDEQVARAEDKR